MRQTESSLLMKLLKKGEFSFVDSSIDQPRADRVNETVGGEAGRLTRDKH